MSDKWLSIIEYARQYNVSDMTIRRRIKTGRIPAQLREGKYYICTSQLEDHKAAIAHDESESSSPNWNIVPKKTFRRPEYQRDSKPSPVAIMNDHGDFKPEYKFDSSLSEVRSSRHIPAKYESALREHPTLLLETQNLMDLCSNALKAASHQEDLVAQNKKQELQILEEKIKTLESELHIRDLKISKLHQDIEDLQLLLKMIENQK